MPETVRARSVELAVEFNGADITKDIRPYLLSAVYTDCEDDDADDLQLTLQDREEIWASKWLGEALSKTLSGGLKIKAEIRRLDASPGAAPLALPCGTFELWRSLNFPARPVRSRCPQRPSDFPPVRGIPSVPAPGAMSGCPPLREKLRAGPVLPSASTRRTTRFTKTNSRKRKATLRFFPAFVRTRGFPLKQQGQNWLFLTSPFMR